MMQIAFPSVSTRYQLNAWHRIQDETFAQERPRAEDDHYLGAYLAYHRGTVFGPGPMPLAIYRLTSWQIYDHIDGGTVQDVHMPPHYPVMLTMRAGVGVGHAAFSQVVWRIPPAYMHVGMLLPNEVAWMAVDGYLHRVIDWSMDDAHNYYAAYRYGRSTETPGYRAEPMFRAGTIRQIGELSPSALVRPDAPFTPLGLRPALANTGMFPHTIAMSVSSNLPWEAQVQSMIEAITHYRIRRAWVSNDAILRGDLFAHRAREVEPIPAAALTQYMENAMVLEGVDLMQHATTLAAALRVGLPGVAYTAGGARTHARAVAWATLILQIGRLREDLAPSRG